MGVKFYCDGMETPVEDKDELTEVGDLGRLYCKDAVPHVENYLEKVGELQEELRAKWKKGLERIRKEAHKNIPGLLPDE